MRLNYRQIAPEGLQKFLDIYGYLHSTTLPEDLLHMLFLRISQLNGCPYCVDLHWKDSVKMGVEPRKLNGLVTWRDMPFFSEKEKTVFAWVEEVTLLPGRQVAPEKLDALKAHFTEREIVDLTYASAHMNALNRIAIAFHAIPTA